MIWSTGFDFCLVIISELLLQKQTTCYDCLLYFTICETLNWNGQNGDKCVFWRNIPLSAEALILIRFVCLQWRKWCRSFPMGLQSKVLLALFQPLDFYASLPAYIVIHVFGLSVCPSVPFSWTWYLRKAWRELLGSLSTNVCFESRMRITIWWSNVKVSVTSHNTFLSITKEFIHSFHTDTIA